MCQLSFILMFVMAHIVAWNALGGGWRGAGRAPFLVFLPALAMLLLSSVVDDSYTDIGLKAWTLASWEMLYFLVYFCLRLVRRQAASVAVQVLPRR